MAGQMILGLSLLVGVHELGHMLAAKFFKMRVEKFAIGFPPKLWSFRWGETEYAFQAIPLGGYVKISGMIDESLDTKHTKTPPQDWEFRAKPAWQRLIVMLGGIIVNLIVGVFIFVAITFVRGDKYLPIEQVNQAGLYPNELGIQLGFKKGDKIIAMNGTPIKAYRDIFDPNFLITEGSRYTVVRNQETMELVITNDFIKAFTSNSQQAQFVSPLHMFKVEDVIKNSPAQKGNLQKNDKILKINNIETPYFQDVVKVLQSRKGKSTDFVIRRANEQLTLTIDVSDEGKVGFSATPLAFDFAKSSYSLPKALVVGSGRAFSIITMTVKSFSGMFKGTVSATESLGGPIEIARKAYGGTWNWGRFWYVTAALSMVLAFMNFLPIPALDGGHVLFLLYEMIIGKPPADSFLMTAQKIGMVLLFTLMIFVFGLDIFRAVMGK